MSGSAASTGRAEPQPAGGAGSGWRAHLALRFERRDAGTVLAWWAHRGPLQVQRPFHPDGEASCHVYVLHPPGGVVGGDELTIEAALEPGAEALLTAPAAGKFYRSAGPLAQARVHLTVAADAVAEWLPPENILFDGARVDALTRVDLAPSARFLGWEIACLGRQAAGERYAHGGLRQRLELWRDGRPLYLERSHYPGGGAVLEAPWGLRGQPVVGSLVATGGAPGLGEAVRSAVGALPAEELFTVSQLQSVLVCRYLGASAARARGCFERAWAVLRPALLGRAACPPRVWRC